LKKIASFKTCITLSRAGIVFTVPKQVSTIGYLVQYELKQLKLKLN